MKYFPLHPKVMTNSNILLVISLILNYFLFFLAVQLVWSLTSIVQLSFSFSSSLSRSREFSLNRTSLRLVLFCFLFFLKEQLEFFFKKKFMELFFCFVYWCLAAVGSQFVSQIQKCWVISPMSPIQ